MEIFFIRSLFKVPAAPLFFVSYQSFIAVIVSVFGCVVVDCILARLRLLTYRTTRLYLRRCGCCFSSFNTFGHLHRRYFRHRQQQQPALTHTTWYIGGYTHI